MGEFRIDDLELNGKKIIQNPDYFCFGIDSVLLANFVESNSIKNKIVDLCSGSGVISIIISQKKKCDKIYAVELQDEMYELLDKNIKYNDLNEKIIGIKSNIKEFSLKEKVDIVVSNPPYKKIGTGTINENKVKYVARHEVECTIEDIFTTASRLLKQKGKLYLVHKPQRLTDLIAVARNYNLEPKKIQFIYPNITSQPSIVLIEYVYFGGNEMRVLPPIIEYNEDGEYSKQLSEIYGSN